MGRINPELTADPNALRRVKSRLDELQATLNDAEKAIDRARAGGTWSLSNAIEKVEIAYDELGDLLDYLVINAKEATSMSDELKGHVTEETTYRIKCNRCAIGTTGACDSEQEAVEWAETQGYEIINDECVCGECAKRIKKEADA